MVSFMGLVWMWGTVENLASRKDAWLGIFNVIPYLAALWGYVILAKRMKFFKATKVKKVIAFVFASSLITLYLGTNVYRAYVFKIYGKAPRSHHGSHGDHGSHGETKADKPETPVMKCEAGKCGAAMKKQ